MKTTVIIFVLLSALSASLSMPTASRMQKREVTMEKEGECTDVIAIAKTLREGLLVLKDISVSSHKLNHNYRL